MQEGGRRNCGPCFRMVIGSGRDLQSHGAVVRQKMRIWVGFVPHGRQMQRNIEMVQNVEIRLHPQPCGKLHTAFSRKLEKRRHI